MTAAEVGESPVTVVAGASRGIGREIARQLSALGHRVVAGCRTSEAVSNLTKDLESSGGISLKMDVTDPESVKQAAKTVMERFGAVDQLIVTAGITYHSGESIEHSKGPLPKLTDNAMTEVFRTNAVGPALAAQHFLPLMGKSARPGVIMCVSSIRASLTLTDGPGSISYAMGKAALNMLVKKVSLWPYLGNTTIFAVHPGWVATGLGGPDAPITVADASKDLVALAATAGQELNGRFVSTTGEDLAW